MATQDDDGAAPPPPAGENIDGTAPPPPAGPIPSRDGPPLSPLVHRREQSAQSQISEVSFDAPWSSKVVAGVLEQVSRDGDVETEATSAKLKRRMTLADINEASPMEAEAETLLIQALEEREKRPQMQDAVLQHVTDEGLNAFEVEPVDEVSSSGKQRFQSAADQVRSSNTVTKGKLVGLAHAMRLLHEETIVNLMTDPSDDAQLDSNLLEPAEQKIPSSDTDTFLQNANALFDARVRPSALKR